MLLNINEVISNIQVDMGQSTPSKTAIIKRWCYEAVREIGVGFMELKTKTYDNISTNILKPSDFVAAAHIYLVTDDDKCVTPTRTKGLNLYGNTPFNFNKYGYRHSMLQSPGWEIGEGLNSFTISSDAADNFSKLILVYYATPIDEEGNPLVPEFAMEACLARCMWKDSARDRARFRSPGSDSRGNAVPLSEVQFYRQEYYTQVGIARGEMNSPSVQEVFELGEAIMFGVTNAYPELISKYQSTFPDLV